jgi:hypothetical protein
MAGVRGQPLLGRAAVVGRLGLRQGSKPVILAVSGETANVVRSSEPKKVKLVTKVNGARKKSLYAN